MIRIRFLSDADERKALGFLASRFPFKTFDTGVTLVPEAALAALAHEGIKFTVEGPASYAETISSRRDAPAAAV